MKADTIRVDAGLKRILINGDESKVLEFNPLDILFAERFYALIDKFEEKRKEFTARLDKLEEDKTEDEHGLPENLPDSFAIMKEMVGFLHSEIDILFKSGTAEMVFGEHDNLDMIQQFFDGLMPFIEKARTAKVKQYTKPAKKS